MITRPFFGRQKEKSMKNKSKEKYKFTVQTKITPEIYINFAKFDTFMLKKRWFFPTFIAVCSIVMAATLYMKGMLLLAVTAGIVAIAFPVNYFNTFRKIMKENTRYAPRGAVIDDYLVNLTEEGFEIYSEEEEAECLWSDIHAAYRLSNCIALYIKKDQSFLISQFNEKRYEQIWAFICDHAGNKAKDRQSSMF